MKKSGKFIVFLLFFVLQSLVLSGQSVLDKIRECPDKAGNIYYNYHFDNPEYTPAPAGYKPFYISHYGRHGSRWLTRDREYDEVKSVFDAAFSADALTDFGKEVYERVKTVYENGIDRGGDLSPLGALQQREIAGRMAGAFPEIFSSGTKINAVSTFVPRCILSMAAFCERLKELNPELEIEKAAGRRTTRYLNCYESSTHPELSEEFHFYRSSKAPWRIEYDSKAGEYIRSGKIVEMLFSDKGFIESIDRTKLARGLYMFAVNMQDVDAGESFYDLFTSEDLYLISIYENYRYFVTNGPSAINKGFPEYYGKILLSDFIEKADVAVAKGVPAADLRFGHDTSVMPLLTMLQFAEHEFDRLETDPAKVAERWPLFELTPMAANIQFVFYRHKKNKGECIVKIMHNEHEMHLPIEPVSGPYYKWSDVRQFYTDYMDSLKDPSSDFE